MVRHKRDLKSHEHEESELQANVQGPDRAGTAIVGGPDGRGSSRLGMLHSMLPQSGSA
jgi:hypothetical protein